MALWACSSQPEIIGTDELAISIDSSGAYPVTTVAGQAPRWELESLAVVRPDPDAGFTRIQSIALDPAGGVWVADFNERTLQRFGDDGILLENRGRVGSGPGEYRQAYAITVTQGRLQIWDPGNSRTTIWTATGKVESSWPWLGTHAGGSPVQWHPGTAGPHLLMPLRSDDDRVVRGLFSLGVEGRADTLKFELSALPIEAFNRECNGKRGSTWFWMSPFVPRFTFTGRDSTVMVAQGANYELVELAGVGDTVRALRRDVARRPVTDADWSKASAMELHEQDSLELSGCTGEYHRFATHSMVTDLVGEESGRLWVETNYDSSMYWDAWDDGRLMGSVPAPEERIRFGARPSILGDRIAIVAFGPEGGQEVRLYRIVGM